MRIKIGTKLIAGHLLAVFLMVALALYLMSLSQKSLQQSDGKSSIWLAEEMLKHIDHYIYLKIEEVQKDSHDILLQKTLSESNREFKRPDRIEEYSNRKEREWASLPKTEITPFMQKLIRNELSTSLRKKFIEFPEKKYGYEVFSEVFVTNKHGANVALTRKTPDYMHDDDEWWQVVKEKGFYVDDVEFDESPEINDISIGVRVDDEKGNFIGVIKALLAVKGILMEAEIAIRKYKTTEIKLITKDGRLIYATKVFRLLEDVSEKEFFKRIKSETNPFIAEEGGIRKLFSYARSKGHREFKGFGWILVMGHDVEEVLKPAFVLRNRMLAASFILIAVGCMFVFLMSRSITKPIAKLIKGAEIIGKGDLEHRVELKTKDEIGELAVAFNQMTERRQAAEGALRESEERFRKAFEYAALGMCLVSPTGRLLKANLYMCQMWGYTEEELLTKTFNDLTHPDDQHIGIEVIRKLLDNTLSFAWVEKRYLHNDGSIIWAMIGTSLLRDSAGKPLYLVSHIQNITERKRTEEALKQSEKRFRDLVENSSVGILIVQNDQIVYTNPEQERLFGPLPQPFEINDFFKNVHPDDLTKFKQFYDAIRSGDAPAMDMETRFFPLGKKASENGMRSVHCRASLIEFQGDRAILFNMVDMTRARELERLVLIREKMASLGHVAAGVAHEIRNPLSGINVYLDAIRENFEDLESASEIKEIIHQAQKAANKIESVIKKVLDFSRPHVSNLRLADINMPIEEAIKLFQVALRKAGIKIESALDEDLPQVYIESQLIEQVILNLITNSSEAMKDIEGPKKISITSTMEMGHIQIEVSDSGKGIPSEINGKIFDPFYTTKKHGSGIGLSLCQRIIADHAGTVEASPSKLGGAQFTIRIPIEKGKSHR